MKDLGRIISIQGGRSDTFYPLLLHVRAYLEGSTRAYIVDSNIVLMHPVIISMIKAEVSPSIYHRISSTRRPECHSVVRRRPVVVNFFLRMGRFYYAELVEIFP